MEDFSRSLQMGRIEVLTTVWPENSTYSSASNCVFCFVCLFVCLPLFNNVVSNSGHVKHKLVPQNMLKVFAIALNARVGS